MAEFAQRARSGSAASGAVAIGAVAIGRFEVNTTGVSRCGGRPCRRAHSRITRTPPNRAWSRSAQSSRCSAAARLAKGAGSRWSTSSTDSEVKSPTIRSTSGCTGSRWKTVSIRL
ncbi:hypothetical protein NKH77_07505 [Streptomyces sp. M19]